MPATGASDPLAALLQLRQLPARLIVGLMSGTSADGVDAALCEVAGAGEATRVKLRGFLNRPFPRALRERIFALAEADTSELVRAGRPDRRVLRRRHPRRVQPGRGGAVVGAPHRLARPDRRPPPPLAGPPGRHPADRRGGGDRRAHRAAGDLRLPRPRRGRGRRGRAAGPAGRSLSAARARPPAGHPEHRRHRQRHPGGRHARRAGRLRQRPRQHVPGRRRPRRLPGPGELRRRRPARRPRPGGRRAAGRVAPPPLPGPAAAQEHRPRAVRPRASSTRCSTAGRRGPRRSPAAAPSTTCWPP